MIFTKINEIINPLPPWKSTYCCIDSHILTSWCWGTIGKIFPLMLTWFTSAILAMYPVNVSGCQHHFVGYLTHKNTHTHMHTHSLTHIHARTWWVAFIAGPLQYVKNYVDLEHIHLITFNYPFTFQYMHWSVHLAVRGWQKRTACFWRGFQISVVRQDF